MTSHAKGCASDIPHLHRYARAIHCDSLAVRIVDFGQVVSVQILDVSTSQVNLLVSVSLDSVNVCDNRSKVVKIEHVKVFRNCGNLTDPVYT